MRIRSYYSYLSRWIGICFLDRFVVYVERCAASIDCTLLGLHRVYIVCMGCALIQRILDLKGVCTQ